MGCGRRLNPPPSSAGRARPERPVVGRSRGPTCSSEEMEMRTAYDFSPLYGALIGADRVADQIEASLKSAGDTAYPPYDIEKVGDDAYRITLATAGFRSEELEVI